MKFIAAIGFDINSRSLNKVSGDCNLLTMVTQVNANQRSVPIMKTAYTKPFK